MPWRRVVFYLVIWDRRRGVSVGVVLTNTTRKDKIHLNLFYLISQLRLASLINCTLTQKAWYLNRFCIQKLLLRVSHSRIICHPQYLARVREWVDVFLNSTDWLFVYSTHYLTLYKLSFPQISITNVIQFVPNQKRVKKHPAYTCLYTT